MKKQKKDNVFVAGLKENWLTIATFVGVLIGKMFDNNFLLLLLFLTVIVYVLKTKKCEIT